MTREDVIKILLKKKGTKSVLAWSKELGVSQQYLSRVLRRSQYPGPAILKKFGLERFVTATIAYRPISSNR